MAWRLAESLQVLRKQLNSAYPGRRKSSDGTIGDEAHQSRSSDHNAWIADGKGPRVVSALDITHDPENGVDAGKLADALVASRDARIKYIISNRRICSGSDGPSPWRWRSYSGSNPHTRHMHLSVKSSKKIYDDKRLWDLNFPKAEPPEKPKPVIKSKIAQASATVATVEAGNAIATANNVLDQVAATKDATDRIGITDQIMAIATSPRFVLAVIVVLVCAGIIYWRWRDHGRGNQ